MTRDADNRRVRFDLEAWAAIREHADALGLTYAAAARSLVMLGWRAWKKNKEVSR